MLQLARLPVFRQIIVVGVVLERAAGRAVDVPEIGREIGWRPGPIKVLHFSLFMAMPPPITS